MRGQDLLEERVRAATTPYRTEIVRVKRHLAELLSDGEAHRTAWLQRRILELEQIPREPNRETLAVAEEAAIETVVVQDHPMLARRRLILAVIEALAELEAQGLIRPADDSHIHPDAEDRSPPVPSVDHVPFQYGGTGSGVRDLRAGPPIVADAYVLIDAYREREAWFLDADAFADLSTLPLDRRTVRSLEEALSSFRRGLFLAASSLLGAAVEGDQGLPAISLRRPQRREETAVVG